MTQGSHDVYDAKIVTLAADGAFDQPHLAAFDSCTRLQVLVDKADPSVANCCELVGVVGDPQSEIYSPAVDSDVATAVQLFCARFYDATGVAWADRATAPRVAGKGVWIPSHAYAECGKGKWEYYSAVRDRGRAPGWLPYTDAASGTLECVYAEWQHNHALHVRCVRSGKWAYRIDFGAFTQTNAEHADHTVRSIRRVIQS